MLSVMKCMQVEAWNSVAQKVNFNLEIDVSEFGHIVPRDSLILDYGRDYGRTCENLNSIGYSNIIGFDSSPEMIRRGNFEVVMNHQQPRNFKSLVNAFTELKFEIIQVQTMTGNNAKAVNYFGRKHLTRLI